VRFATGEDGAEGQNGFAADQNVVAREDTPELGRVALYLRTETPAGEISRSVLRLRRLALEVGLRVEPRDVLIDAGYPGSTPERPAYQTLCRRVETGEVAAVIVGAVASLAETLAAYEPLWRAAEGHDLAVYEFAGPSYPRPLRQRDLTDVADDVAALERRLAWDFWLGVAQPQEPHDGAA
jgi:hypothetical protein